MVNGQTRGAAAKLATDLREARDGLDFWQRGTELKPDITVTVKQRDEKKFLENPYAALAQAKPIPARPPIIFSPFIDHTSEADLVREKIKDGDEDENSAPPRADRAAKAVHPRPGAGAGGGFDQGARASSASRTL